MKKFLALVLALSMAFSMVACGGAASGSEDAGESASGSTGAATDASETTFGLKPFEERQTLRVGYFAGSAHAVPFYIADVKGFFDELNIDVEYEPYTNGPAMMEASSSWDVATAGAAGDLVGMLGYDLVCIGVADYEENMGLFVRADGNLADKNAEDWKGTTWLYPTGTNAQMILGGELEELGLTFDDIESVNMDIASALTAFKGGQGDGIAVWNAIATSAEDAGFVRVDDAGTLGITVFNGFMATPEALSERRELVKAAWEVYYLTWQWCNESEENMDEAVALYLESCENEGIACDEHIAEEVMGYYACPTVSEVAKLMSEASPDDAGLYTSRDLLQAEKDLLVTMDFLISIGKYSEEDRNTILDNEMTDGSIAAECLADMDALGVQYN